ncbi:MAG: hypothetical protein KME45_05590 [Stenomitos rutilans HA7619-LM2]|jgi:hypothetical protein|nr:hypothetical protein [Stenomitos rutilans HA7619-LM2]
MVHAALFQRLGQSILITTGIMAVNHTLPQPVQAQERLCQRLPQSALCQEQRLPNSANDRSAQPLQVIQPTLDAVSKHLWNFNNED